MSNRMIHERAIYINEETLKDLVAAYLYQTTVVHDDEEVLELSLGMPNVMGTREINFKFIKEKEPEVIIHS